MEKKISRLAIKFIIGFILLGALICTFTSAIGFHQYKNSMENVYMNTAYNIAKQAVSYMDKTTLKDYLELLKRTINGDNVEEEINQRVKSDEYKLTHKLLMNLRHSMEANDIFLVYADLDVLKSYSGSTENWEPFYYIYDSYSKEEYSYQLGDKSTFNPSFIDYVVNIIETKERAKEKIITKSQFGFNIYAIEPLIINEDVLFLCVEFPMRIIQQALRQYIISAILVSIIIVVIVIVFYMLYLYKNVIHPINIIAQEANNFVSNGSIESFIFTKIKTDDEIEYLAHSVLKMQIDINNYITDIKKITGERERICAELDVAKNIQTSILPLIFPAFPERDEFEIYASMQPAKEVGGDFYDFFLTDDNHLVMVIADVSGKGVPAALFMMIAKTLIKTAAQTGISPKEILEKVNNQLYENNDEQMFVTVWIGKLNLTTGHMVCVNAGHEYPAIYHKNDKFNLLKDKHGFVVAGIKNAKYTEYELFLSPNDIIYVYSDGVAEATNRNNQLYGTERMVKGLNRCPYKKPRVLADYIKQDVDEFVGENEQFDDITMLCMRFKGKVEYGSKVV